MKTPTVLDDKSISNINKVLEDLVASGEVKIAELAPSLGALLSEPENGGFPGRVFAGEVVGYREGELMTDFDDADSKHPADVLELKDVTGAFNGETSNLIGHNGGMKAKMRAVKDHKFVLVAFKGEVESQNERFAPWKDYLLMGLATKDLTLQAVASIEKAVGRKAISAPAAAPAKA